MFHVLLIFTVAIGVGLGASEKNSGAPTTSLDGVENNSTEATKESWQPEPQEPSGKFTTATEVKPILSMTKSAWVAVREYEGNDLLYFTHLAAWRCGLHEVRYGLNGAAEQIFEVEECYIDTAQPNALKMETHLPYIILELGSVESVSVTLIFDDGTKDSAIYRRSDILMP